MADLERLSEEFQAELEKKYGNDAGWHPCSDCSGGVYVTDYLDSLHDETCPKALSKHKKASRIMVTGHDSGGFFVPKSRR